MQNKILIVLFIFISTILNAQEIKELPELLTKQAVSNIRFLSEDGKFTYYQKNSGSLLMSTNYKVQEILNANNGTQYTLIGTAARKKILIMQYLNFNTLHSLRSRERIHVVNYGESKPTFLGEGAAAKLHLNDGWVSFYDYYTRTLHFVSTLSDALKFSIQLNNNINLYYAPQVIMVDDNTIYYTDLNDKGIVGLIKHTRTTNKTEVLYKTSSPLIKFEMCEHKGQLITGEFGINGSTLGSTITKQNFPISDFAKRETIYTSKENDIGQIICNFDNDLLFFIKNYGKPNESILELSSLSVSTKEVKPLTNLRTVTSILNMDGSLLVLNKGKYLIAKGRTDYKSLDLMNALPPGSANSTAPAQGAE